MDNVEDYIEVLPGERWIRVESCPKYSLSSLGRLFSWKSKYKYTYKPIGLVSGSINKQRGWRWIRLDYASPEGLHRLVAKAFVPNPFNKPEVIHLNGDIQDNSADNLAWVSHTETF